MKFRRFYSILTVSAMAASLLGGCGVQGASVSSTTKAQAAAATTAAGKTATTAAGKTATTAAGKTATTAAAAPGSAKKDMVRWLYPGSEQKYHKELTDYVNSLLDKDNMNITFQAMPIGWDVWEQKINLMFQAKDEFEFVQVPEGFGPGYVQLWNMGASVRLNEMLDKYAPTIKKVVPQWLWQAATIDGNITTIPAFWTETANLKGGICLRKDLYDKYGMTLPTNPDELIAKSVELKKHITDDGLFDKPTYMMMRYQEIQTFLHRTYDSYPFTVIDQLLLVRQDGKVESWVDSPEFKKDCEFYNKCYKSDLVYPDLLSVEVTELTKDFEYGNYLFSEWNTLNSDPFMRKNAGDDTINNVYIVFNPEKHIMRDQGVRNSNIVSSTSPNPEAAVRFHEWMYANKDAYYAVQFGKEGLTYKVENDQVDFIPDEPNLGLADWMVANINIQPKYVGSNPEWNRLTMTEEMNADNSVTIGFAFNSEPVTTEYANCLSEVKNVIYPLRAGVVSYADGHDNASSALKAAGIDKVVAEYQTQLTAWLKTRQQ